MTTPGCDHKMVDNGKCLKCGKTYKELKQELDDAFNSWNSNQQAEQAVNHNLGLALLDDTELVHCKTCGRITVPTREMRDGVTYLVCKCGEEMEEEPEDE